MGVPCGSSAGIDVTRAPDVRDGLCAGAEDQRMESVGSMRRSLRREGCEPLRRGCDRSAALICHLSVAL